MVKKKPIHLHSLMINTAAEVLQNRKQIVKKGD